MESEEKQIYIGDRLPRFQAAVACLGVRPKLRAAGWFCIIVGGLAAFVITRSHVPATSPVLWAYLAVFCFGIYIYRPNPQPWALPAAGFIILAVLAVEVYAAYGLWRRSHVAPEGGGLGTIIDIVLAVTLFVSYFSYKRNLAATDDATLEELREIAFAVNKADLDRNAGIVELTHRNNRVRLRRVDQYVLVVARHYIAFGKYSKLDAVAIVKPDALRLEVVGAAKPGHALKVRLSGPVMKTAVMKLKPQYLARLSNLGIATTGLTAAKQEVSGA